MKLAKSSALTSLAEAVSQHWGQGPASFKADMFTETDSWETVQRSCWDFRHGKASDTIKLYANGRQIVTELYRRLPGEGDASFKDYADRLLGETGAESFLFYSAGCQSTCGQAMRERIKTMIGPVFERFGHPDGRVELEVFGGVYRDTPGGIHREACHNLQAVTVGHKEMHVWSPDTWSVDDGSDEPVQRERAVYRADFLDARSKEENRAGAVLKAGPGEVFYWPPYHWHVGASPTLSLANVIAVYMSTTIGDALDAFAAELAAMNPSLDRWGGTLADLEGLLTELVADEHIPRILDKMRAVKRENLGLHMGYA